MSRLAPEEIAREARRVLRRLESPRAALLARPSKGQRGGGYAVARSAQQAGQSRVTLGEDFVLAFAQAGWIAADGPGRYVLTPEGRAFLARELGGPDGFAGQHREMQNQTLEENGITRTVRVNLAESPLTRLRGRALLDAAQFAAGEKLRRDYTLAQLTPRMGVNWDAPVVSGGRGAGADTVSDIAVTARQRFSRAMAKMGPGLGDLAFDVCCELTPLERAEAGRGWAKRSARVVLILALNRLAAHYGLVQIAPSRSPIRAWTMQDEALEDAG